MGESTDWKKPTEHPKPNVSSHFFPSFSNLCIREFFRIPTRLLVAEAIWASKLLKLGDHELQMRRILLNIQVVY